MWVHDVFVNPHFPAIPARFSDQQLQRLSDSESPCRSPHGQRSGNQRLALAWSWRARRKEGHSGADCAGIPRKHSCPNGDR